MWGVGGSRSPRKCVNSGPWCLWGLNIIRRCYRELIGQHGLALFDLPAVAEAPESVTQALQKCHQASAPAPRCTTGRVKVRGRKACRIPGGTVKLVVATCSVQYSGISVLFEPLDSGLPVGQGTTYIPTVNVGSSAVLLYPRTVVGTLYEVRVVNLPTGVTEVPSGTATMASQSVLPTMPGQIEATDLSALSTDEQDKVKSLLRKYETVSSTHDGDLGCTDLISHDIPLLEDIPVRQHYRRIPPSEYEVVKEHINKLLEVQVIRESSSPYGSPIVLVKKKDGSLRLCGLQAAQHQDQKRCFPSSAH